MKTLLAAHDHFMSINFAQYAGNPAAKPVLAVFDKYRPIIKAFSDAGFTETKLATQCYLSGHLEVGNCIAYVTIYQSFKGSKPALEFDFSIQGSTMEKLFGEFSMNYSDMINENITPDEIKKILSKPEYRDKPKFDTSNIFSIKPILKKFI